MKGGVNEVKENGASGATADQEISKRQADDLRELIALRERFEEGTLGEEEQLATRLDQTAGAFRQGVIPAIDSAARSAENFNFTFNPALEDAIINGEDLSNVVKALEQDIARMLIRASITEPLGSGIRGILRDPASLLDPARFGAGGGADLSGLAGGFDMPAFAEGTPFVERTGPAFLHRGEAVIPADQNRMGSITVNIVQNIDSRSDQATIVQATMRAKDMAVAEIAALQNRRGSSRIG